VRFLNRLNDGAQESDECLDAAQRLQVID